MAEEKQRPCDDLKKVQDVIEKGRERLHMGDIIMAEIKLTLKTIGDKVDNLDIKMDKQFEKVAADIEELKMKPGKRWDGLVTVIISLVAGTLIGLLFSSLGI